MTTAAHTGFHGESGVQLHSCGPLYPWTIRGVGDTCQAFHGIDGRTGTRFPYNPAIEGSHGIAYAKAEQEIADVLLFEKIMREPIEKLAA